MYVCVYVCAHVHVQAEGCDRIKILGDGYVCVAGVPQECDDHADRCIKTGLRLAASVG